MFNTYTELSQNAATKKVSIIIIDDHKLIRESFSLILDNSVRYKVIASCSSADEGIRYAEALAPEIVITDINMPGMNGIDAIPLIKGVSPRTRIVGISMHSVPAIARKMIRCGALAYLTKKSSIEELFKALEEVIQGKKYICSEIRDIISQQLLAEKPTDADINCLSKREIEIIDFIKDGFSSKEIAKELGISLKTVEVHRHNILKKLQLSNTAALVNYINLHSMGG